MVKVVGPGSISKALCGDAMDYRLNTLNSTSVSSHLLMNVLESFNPKIKDFKNPQSAAYNSLFDKLLNRRLDLSTDALTTFHYWQHQKS